MRFHAQPGLSYERVETSLLRAFEGFPAVVAPPNDGKRPARLFEVRTYESSNTTTLRRKVKMFNDGEIGAFQRAGGWSFFCPRLLLLFGQVAQGYVYVALFAIAQDA